MNLKHQDPMGLCGSTLDRRYEVDEFVAEGGFGVVYRGRLLPWKEPVAIKVCKLDPAEDETLRPESHSHFLTEAAIVAKLTHPAIVRVRDFGVSPMPDGQDAPWLVFDWVSGRTLADDLDERWNDPPRAPWEVLELMRPVLRALAMAHAQGIAHRGIKPANLMLMARTGGNDEVPVRVLDFGVSKVLELDERRLPTGMTATRSVTVFCSPENATPEQLSASRTGPWTDVYQFALVVTEMLTHQRAQRGDDLVEAQRDAMSPTRPTPAAHGVDVGTWEPVLARAVALRPADRYADAGQLLEALEANLPGVPSGAMNTPGTPASPPAPSGLTASPPGADEVDDLTATVAQPNPHLRVVAPLSPATATLPSAEAPRTVPVVWIAGVLALAVLVAVAAMLSRS